MLGFWVQCGTIHYNNILHGKKVLEQLYRVPQLIVLHESCKYLSVYFLIHALLYLLFCSPINLALRITIFFHQLVSKLKSMKSYSSNSNCYRTNSENYYSYVLFIRELFCNNNFLKVHIWVGEVEVDEGKAKIDKFNGSDLGFLKWKFKTIHFR